MSYNFLNLRDSELVKEVLAAYECIFNSKTFLVVTFFSGKMCVVKWNILEQEILTWPIGIVMVNIGFEQSAQQFRLTNSAHCRMLWSYSSIFVVDEDANNTWPDILTFLYECCSSSENRMKEVALHIIM